MVCLLFFFFATRKQMAEVPAGTTVSSVVSTTVSDGKGVVEQSTVRAVWQTVSRAPAWAKWGALAYFSGSLLTYGVGAYQGGKRALLSARKERKDQKYVHTAVVEGCKDGSDFWGSLVWPWTLAKTALPALVLAVNKENPSPPSDPRAPR